MVEGSCVHEPGLYLLYAAGHFTAVRIINSDCCRVSLSHRCHEHVDVHPSHMDFTQFEAVMKIAPGTSTKHYGRDFLGGAVSWQRICSCSGTVPPPTTCTCNNATMYIVMSY